MRSWPRTKTVWASSSATYPTTSISQACWQFRCRSASTSAASSSWVERPAPSPTTVDAVLARVREGETTLRNLVTEEEGIYSGLQPERLGATVNEALTPIRGKTGVIGALCLGRRGNSGFSQQDVSALDDLGSMAGVAVENSRILQVVSGQASRLDTALDALGEVSQALTTVTQGARV